MAGLRSNGRGCVERNDRWLLNLHVDFLLLVA
jgi:hypothetical protein